MIEVGRNSIIVRNVDLKSEAFRKIKNRFSLYNKIQFKFDFSAFTIINKDLYFPASISLISIKGYFPEKQIIENYKSSAKTQQCLFNMIYPPRDDLQKKALVFLLKLKKDNKNRQRFLSLGTGSGKTFVSISFISAMKKNAMIIVDTLSLAFQWKREFLKHTDLKKEDIRILSGKETIEKEKEKHDGKIYIAIHRTLGNLISENKNSINSLMNKLKIGIRIFDESHVEFKNICLINSLSNVEYTLYLTATPNRSNFNDDNLYGKVFGKVPYFNGKEDAIPKYHTVVLYKINSQPDLNTKLGIKTRYGFSSARWARYLENDAYEIFFSSVEQLIEKFSLLKRNKKIAIVLPTISLIKKLKLDLEELYKIDVGIFIGEIKKDKRIEELKKSVILTNASIFDKAIDVTDLEILINYTSFASVVKTEQIIGRLRYTKGQSAIFIDVTDYGFNECIKQSKIRKRFYKKKAKKIIEIE